MYWADFDVIAVPGHTLGHIAYYHRGLLFCGDTLFAAGCGRLFEGTPADVHLAVAPRGLPENTLVYCTHEYTLSNLRLPRRSSRQSRYAGTPRNRYPPTGVITLPSTVALEKRTNPFLRTAETSVKEKVDERTGTETLRPICFCCAKKLERHVLSHLYDGAKTMNG
jgi:hydroxyacylglutathione hydrolase